MFDYIGVPFGRKLISDSEKKNNVINTIRSLDDKFDMELWELFDGEEWRIYGRIVWLGNKLIW